MLASTCKSCKLLSWHSATFLRVCNCLDSLQLSWKSATVLKVCNFIDNLQLYWKSVTVLTVCDGFDSLELSWQFATVLTVCQRTIAFIGTILRRIYRSASEHHYACRPAPRIRQGCPDISRAGWNIRIRINISDLLCAKAVLGMFWHARIVYNLQKTVPLEEPWG